MTKTYPTEVLLSISTGVLLCQFSDMHECCEFLAGEPIFTHQFAHKGFVDELKAAVLAQLPQFDVDATHVNTDNYEQFRDEQVKRLGASHELIPMASMMDHARESFTEPLRGKTVVVVTAPETPSSSATPNDGERLSRVPCSGSRASRA